MKRKLFLFFGTLIIILLAFGTYQMFVPGISIFDPTYHIRRPNFTASRGGSGPELGVVTEFSYTDYTADGRKRGTFTAKSWSQEDDGSFSLIKPSAVMYQKDGTRTYMTADRGWIEGEQVAKGITVRRGRFEGNVVIYFDQSKDVNRKQPQDRTPEEILRDCIRISMNDIEFSQELLELRTNSEIYLWSKTVDLVGKGLVILWNDSPRELRLLRIVDGDIMLIKELPEQMDMIQLPTQSLAEQKRKENKQAEELKKATPKPKILVEKTSPTTAPVAPATQEGEGEFEITLGETVDSQGNTEPAQTMKIVRRSDSDARNIYEAQFNNNVRVFSGQRKLIGAVLLTLKFEWDRAWRQGGGDKTSNTDSQALSDMNRDKTPSSAPADMAATKPAKGKKLAIARPKGDNWMEIYWDGPLEIKPVGKTDSPNRKHCTLSGEGPAVQLSDADARIICRQFSFENPQQEANFRGAKDFPVRMMLARGDEIECNGLVRFVRSEGRAYLDGPGSMNRYAKGGETGSGGEDYMLLPHLPTAASDLTEKITWQGNVIASFDEIKSGKSMRPFLKDAEFRKNVFIERFMPDGKPSDYVRCDILDIDIAATSRGKAYPRQVTARGNVDAFQQGSKVLSRFVQIDFVPRTDAAAANPQSMQIAGLDGARVEPSYIRARGDVDITYVDPKKTDEQPMRLVGQTLDSDLLKRLAVVTGKPARIWQGTNKITGDVIFFDEPAEAVKVEGPGTLDFTSRQDFNGNTSGRVRDVHIKWLRDMLYHGQSGLALINGNVDMLSEVDRNKGQDAMLCDQMKLRFLKRQEDIASVVAANNRKDKKDKPLGLNIDRYSKRQISSIEALGSRNEMAALLTSSQDPLNSGWLEKRMQLRGRRIVYNALTGEAEVKGAGTLMAEDYRLPEKKTLSGRTAG
ncbi:MAG TPA: hypothetical protein PKK48_03345, partial [Phycisphaerae bacterium]|nr:hypothetical protein [Phycisphaerae bacterium]